MTREDLRQIATAHDLRELVLTFQAEFKRLHNEIAVLRDGLERNGQLPPERLFYSPAELADIMGVTNRTITRWCASGELEATQVGGEGGTWLIHKDELARVEQDAKDKHVRERFAG